VIEKRLFRGALLAGAALAALLVIGSAAELALRLAGVRSYSREMSETSKSGDRYAATCEKLRTQQVKVIPAFFTDGDGIFRANPAHDFTSWWHGGSSRINPDGFRGNDFTPVAGEPTLLLLGDSFTFGAAAKPITSSFADLLGQAGYHVFNAGIPGTDPRQYAALAAKLVPRLKPTVTAVFVYLGNDLRPSPRRLMPHKNQHYVTNVGFFSGTDAAGNYFPDADASIGYFRTRCCGDVGDPLGWFLFRTALGKGLAKALEGTPKADAASPLWVRETLLDIERVCRENGSRLEIFLIPKAARKGPGIRRVEDLPQHKAAIFQGLPVRLPGDLTVADYEPPPRGHFNNAGHLKFAGFVEKTLRADR